MIDDAFRIGFALGFAWGILCGIAGFWIVQ